MDIIEYLEKLSRFPAKEYLITDKEGVVSLDFDFLVRQLNEIFSCDNWKSTFNCENENGNIRLRCTIAVKNNYGLWVDKSGTCLINNNGGYAEAMMTSFRLAVAGHGNIFGRQLLIQFDKRE